MIIFPLQQLKLVNHSAEDNNKLGIFNLYGVSNHYGTVHGRHYTSFCKSYIENVWHNFDDHNVTKLSTSNLNSSATYLLF